MLRLPSFPLKKRLSKLRESDYINLTFTGVQYCWHPRAVVSIGFSEL